MNQLIILPIILPLVSGALLVLSARRSRRFRRTVSVLTTVVLLVVDVRLLSAASAGTSQVYELGHWPAPYGIVLVLDRLSALMLLLTAALALFSLLYAIRGADTAGKRFHALFQFQLTGLNGAFLTGDLFNLFVFFEILLLASYGLLLHGGSRVVCRDSRCDSLYGGPARTRAALHYAVLNLVGSSLFLLALGVIYAAAGTLNMAALSTHMAEAATGQGRLLQAAGLLLLVVFGLKAALAPLYLWLPATYSTASAPVAALFAIMTKVGVYAILRIGTLIFGPAAGGLSGLLAPWLVPLALATFVVGALGTFAATSLRRAVAYLTVASIGMVLTGVGVFTGAGISGALYYLIHTTLITGGMFLLVDLIAMQRWEAEDHLVPGPAVTQSLVLGGLFFVAAVSMAGLPPFSGAIGKLLILKAMQMAGPLAPYAWSAILGGSLVLLLAMARAGSTLFWKTVREPEGAPVAGTLALAGPVALLAAGPLLVLFAAPVLHFTERTAEQLLAPQGYVRAVMGEGGHD